LRGTFWRRRRRLPVALSKKNHGLSGFLTDTLRLVRSGRSADWLKSKNPACEAVKREAEEDWGK
jgi:hypothetical protein